MLTPLTTPPPKRRRRGPLSGAVQLAGFAGSIGSRLGEAEARKSSSSQRRGCKEDETLLMPER